MHLVTWEGVSRGRNFKIDQSIFCILSLWWQMLCVKIYSSVVAEAILNPCPCLPPAPPPIFPGQYLIDRYDELPN